MIPKWLFVLALSAAAIGTLENVYTIASRLAPEPPLTALRYPPAPPLRFQRLTPGLGCSQAQKAVWEATR